ncbi:uncharacterized protein ACHE_20536S [Aspergillus chevalieri]|uniref:Ribonucleases P/MRP subunit Pop8-like domain-containing protein n=1 Tax=Aspergillus chevalieri TaxID=182096 RepID=A0A7R7VI00_ASPCH|nr:uncharacterized protein ACHE_20536S [Aspergillus chevalieri]BCR85078.1 hypothetical protein ACHE_20536S [Aspergillus chevalieri]
MSTQDTQPATQAQPPLEQKASKRKPSDMQPPIHFTARDPPWTYLKLQLISQAQANFQAKNDTPLDPLTARTYLTAALAQFLGLVGTSISIDILKIASSSTSKSIFSATPTSENVVWIRVPRPDAAAVVAALSSWIGGTTGNGGVAWRVCAKGNFLGALVAGDGRDLFVP